MTPEEQREIISIAAQEFTKASKRSRNDQGRGHYILGHIVERWTQHYGLSQSDLAEGVGRHQTFVNKVINGHRGVSIETLADMTAILGDGFAVEYLKALRELKQAGEI